MCLSHLRWDWVYQRPQHLAGRAASDYEVVFWEEPVVALPGETAPSLRLRQTVEGVTVAVPVLPAGLGALEADAAQRSLLDGLLGELSQPVSVAWYYTPMALDFAGHVPAAVTVFDSMDELSAFAGASARLPLLERRLMRGADLVFTGGRSLYAAKRHRHPRVSLFPSSVDGAHFRAARGNDQSPAWQAALPRPRIGYFGVIDERLNLPLLHALAEQRPDWQFVMLGPVTKIDPAALPRRSNLHWRGLVPYAELPFHLSGWDAGLMPFALNEATRFISPTKTPEYLSAGVPVVSTPVPDVMSDWGQGGLVPIADDAPGLAALLEKAMAGRSADWLARVDARLAGVSWDATWAAMRELIEQRRSATSEEREKGVARV